MSSPFRAINIGFHKLILRQLLVMYMQKLGAEYATAENGLVAVQKYKASDHFDLVFLGQYILESIFIEF